jgi:predicted protein tyrosine phosphatase
MPWIQNVSRAAVAAGQHMHVRDNCMLIQIVGPAEPFPVPKYQFREVHQFEFMDLEQDDPGFGEFKITDQQAADLVGLLQHALHTGQDVIVHCVAGVCRSGAVAEVGVIMGFDDAGEFRIPNLLVKHKMMQVLGLTYQSD